MIQTNLKQLRLERKLLQTDVAKAMGVSVVTVNRWEKGKVVPSSLHLLKLCEFFGSEATISIMYMSRKSNRSSLTLPKP